MFLLKKAIFRLSLARAGGTGCPLAECLTLDLLPDANSEGICVSHWNQTVTLILAKHMC